VAKLGLHSLLYPLHTLEESVSRLLRFGVDCIELVLDFPHVAPQDFSRELASRIRSIAGSQVDFSIHAPIFEINLSSPYEVIRRHSVESVVRSVEVASWLGSRVVTIHPPPPPPSFWGERALATLQERFASSIKECLKSAEDRGVLLCLENTPESGELFYQYFNTMRGLAPENSCISFDVGHAFILANASGYVGAVGSLAEKLVALEIIRLRDFIAHVHVHDNDGLRDLHLPPTYGNIDFGPILQALRDIDFNGQMILEVRDPQSVEPTDFFVEHSLTITRALLDEVATPEQH